jgi:hypothetical protein
MTRTIAAAVIMLMGSTIPAMAADTDVRASEPLKASLTAAHAPLGADVDWSLAPVPMNAPKRGAMLPALYVSLATLNAYDAYATSRGSSSGAREANPLMRPVAGNTAALWAVKGSVTAVSITFAERLWRQNRKASAIAVMALSNGLMAYVAAHNRAVLAQGR